MLECKNDPARKYKGDEPSPKGLGWCAHAEKAGTRKVGRDKKTWTVTVDANGRKAWRKAVKRKANSKSVGVASSHPRKRDVAYALSDNEFSDGSIVQWDCRSDVAPGVLDESSSPVPYAEYKDVTASDVDVQLSVDSDGLAGYTAFGGGHKILLKGPFTVGDLFEALRKHYRALVRSDEYDNIYGLFGDSSKDGKMVPWSMKKIRSKIKTRGQSRGKWCVYAGCSRVKTWTEFLGGSAPLQAYTIDFVK